MKCSLAIISAFAADSLAGPIEMRQNGKAQALKAKEDELCKLPNKFGLPEDECRRQVAQCVFEQGPRAQNFDGVAACMERKHGSSSDSSNSAPAPTKKLLPFLEPQAGGDVCGIRSFEENVCGTKEFCEGIDKGSNWREKFIGCNPFKSTADCFAAHEKAPNSA